MEEEEEGWGVERGGCHLHSLSAWCRNDGVERVDYVHVILLASSLELVAGYQQEYKRTYNSEQKSRL